MIVIVIVLAAFTILCMGMVGVAIEDKDYKTATQAGVISAILVLVDLLVVTADLWTN